MNLFIKFAATQERFSLANIKNHHLTFDWSISEPMRNRTKKHRVLHWDIFAVPTILFIVNLLIWIFQQLQIHCISKHMDGYWNWLHLNFTLQHKQNNDQTSCAWLHFFSNVAVLFQKLLRIQWSRKKVQKTKMSLFWTVQIQNERSWAPWHGAISGRLCIKLDSPRRKPADESGEGQSSF